MDKGVLQVLEAVDKYGYDTKAYKALGEINVVQSDNYLLFNYTDKATYEGRWNDVEMVSRGLIIHVPTLTVAALPFGKFFNLGEKPHTSLEAVGNKPCEITAKLDGSLGILYPHSGEFRVATRGSFTSTQAQWATKYFNIHYSKFPFELLEDYTFLFEIIYPENRVVIGYGKEQAGLHLIGIRHIKSGKDLDYSEMNRLADWYGMPVTPLYEFNSIRDILPLVKTSKGIEGWVAKFEDGFRVKIKTEEYLLLHKLVCGLTPSRVREALLTDREAWGRMMLNLPEEFYQEAWEIAGAIEDKVKIKQVEVIATYQDEFEATGLIDNRKEFALKVTREYKPLSPYLFAMLDGKDIYPMLLKNIDVSDIASAGSSMLA